MYTETRVNFHCCLELKNELTESCVKPVAEAEHSPINIKRGMVHIIVVLFREHIYQEHEKCVDERQYRQEDICGAFDARSGEFESGKW